MNVHNVLGDTESYDFLKSNPMCSTERNVFALLLEKYAQGTRSVRCYMTEHGYLNDQASQPFSTEELSYTKKLLSNLL